MSDYDDYDDYGDYDHDNYDDDERYDYYGRYSDEEEEEEDYGPEDDYAAYYDREDDYESDEDTHTSKYKPEIPPERIKQIIKEVMAKAKVTEEEIPAGVPFDITDDHKKSKRYFEVKGFAWFQCSTKHRYWASAHAWCFIDLKEQKICYRDTQGCQKCNQNALPAFDEAAIRRMAEFVVKQYLIRTRRWEGGASASAGTTDDDGRGPHDEERCGKCKRLGQSCWK